MTGDRHLRQSPDGRLHGSPLKLATVYVKAAPEYARSIAGQHLLQLLINLLSRQFGVIQGILIDVVDCPVHPGVFLCPQIDKGTLVPALMTLGKAVSGGLTTISVADDSDATSLIYVGDGLDPLMSEKPGIAVVGHGWRAITRTSGPVKLPQDELSNPIGPYLAACVGAGFAFKTAYNKNKSVDAEFNLWTRSAEEGPNLQNIELPPAYVLGLGAVGAAFGHTLAAAKGIRGSLVVVDPQKMSETDRNRLTSGSSTSVGKYKTELFHELFASAKSEIVVNTFKGKWPNDYLGEPYRETPEEFRIQESKGIYQWVISCVDRDYDRVAIGEQFPRHVLSGSTLGMTAQTAYYSVVDSCECIICRHRTPHQLGVEALTEKLRLLATSDRKMWYDEHGADQRMRHSIEEYLNEPTCAGLGAADLAKLSLQGPVDWTVSFVSAAAGIVLAARFIHAALKGVRSGPSRFPGHSNC